MENSHSGSNTSSSVSLKILLINFLHSTPRDEILSSRQREFHAKETIEYFLGKKTKNIFVIPSEQIDSSVICFDSNLIIHVDEYTIKAFENVISYKMPIIEYDGKEAQNLISIIKEKCKIDAQVLNNRQHVRRYHKKKRKPTS